MTLPPLRLGAFLAILLLTACGPDNAEVIEDKPAIGTLPSGANTDSQTDEVAVGTEPCDLDPYRGLVGTNIAATTFPTGPRLRVFNIHDIVTRDYIPQRANIVYDNAGRITQVYCG